MSLYCDFRKNFGSFCMDIKLYSGNQTMALLGSSGSGKSMTLRCIAGIERPDEGQIILNGMTLFDSKRKINLPTQQRNVGFLFQNYALFPNMTVEKNICLGVKVKDKDARKNLADNLIAAFDLNGLEAHYPYQLSGGQMQRCALARMMAGDPEILMLDEPLSALDSYLRWKVEQKIGEIFKKFNKTVLYVSHNRDEVFHLCDEVAVLNQGKVDIVKKKWDLFTNPVTYQAALLSGCKNITTVTHNESTIIAAEWGIEFEMKHQVFEVAYIGIRAHQLYPAYFLKNEKDKIVFEYEIINEIEETFGYILMIRQCGSSRPPIRWEIDKFHREEMRGRDPLVGIRKKEILLLSK